MLPLRAVLCLLLTLAVARAAVPLDHLRVREHPDFRPDRATLTVGRDGRVYLASGGNSGTYLLRLSPDGRHRDGSVMTHALVNATADAKGVIATANAHFSHCVTVFGPDFAERAKLDDFLNNDALGYASPTRIECGASGDFYAADCYRDRIVRLDADGKQLRAYPIPRVPLGNAGQVVDFRVCEKTSTFVVLPSSGPLFRVGFDGKVRHVLDAKTDPGVRNGYPTFQGGFTVLGDGSLAVMGPFGDGVRIVSPEGKLTRTIAIDGAPFAKPGAANGFVTGLGVTGNTAIIRRSHPTELFRAVDMTTGKTLHVAQAAYERTSATLPERILTEGARVPLAVKHERTTPGSAPKFRVRLRPLDGDAEREAEYDGKTFLVPTGVHGVHVLTITPDLAARGSADAPDNHLRTWVDIRPKGVTASLTVTTAHGRRHFARGETVTLTATLRGKAAETWTPKLVDAATGKAVRDLPIVSLRASTKVILAANDFPGPGRYRVAGGEATWAVSSPEIVIGLRPAADDYRMNLVQYGDYSNTYAEPDTFDAAAVAADHARRFARLGVTRVVDRLGVANNAGMLRADAVKAARAELVAFAEKDPLAPHPDSLKGAFPLAPFLDAYAGAGVEQLAILMYNDAGLPLGTGFDGRKPNVLAKTVRDLTTTMSPYPAFRGWSWASNWWVFDKRGADGAVDADEKKAYIAALEMAKKSGTYDPVLDTVSSRRLSFAVTAQEMFAKSMRDAGGNRLLTSVAAPYRNVESYPPVTFANVDQIDQQAQWEQIAVPYATAFGADFYRRPGKPAWAHPEIWNDSGTGEQIVPTLFQAMMRGVDGIGWSGPVPTPWPGRAVDDRSGQHGMASVARGMGEIVKRYGPWLRTLKNADRVAIIASSRQLRIDEWTNTMGTHFARLAEAHAACLHAGHPASVVFTDDLKSTPKDLERFKAILVVGRTVEADPTLIEALKATKAKVFHDGTCRPELVKGLTPLGVSFDSFEKDRHPASDDAAYERFPRYVMKSVPALRKALDPVAERAAKCDTDEVLVSERTSGKGRYVFVVNNATPKKSPGVMWRTSLLVANRVPLVADVNLSTTEHVYDVFAGGKPSSDGVIVSADLRHLHGRIFAVLPAEIAKVRLVAAGVSAGDPRAEVTFSVTDAKGDRIEAGLPFHVRVTTPDGKTLAEEETFSGPDGVGTFSRPLPKGLPGVTIEVRERVTNTSAAVECVPARRPVVPTVRGAKPTPAPAPVASLFGARLRDVAVDAVTGTAVCNAFDGGENLYALNADDGRVTWRRRVGHGHAFAPSASAGRLTAVGFDDDTAEGYHLYDIDSANGNERRRYAHFGLPGRLPHRFVPNLFNDRVANFAAGVNNEAWYASAGNLGVAAWDASGKLLWKREWWKEHRRAPVLAALHGWRLAILDGLTLTVVDVLTGAEKYRLVLAKSGTIKRVRAAGSFVAVLADTDGGRVFVVRNGELARTIAAAGDDLDVTTWGTVVVADTRRLSWYRDGSLAWSMPMDDRVWMPRLSSDDERVAVSTEGGTLAVIDKSGKVVFRHDLFAPAACAWVGGDLVAATWLGKVIRFAPDGKRRWETLVTSASRFGEALSPRRAPPTSRVVFTGNADATSRNVSENLLNAKNCTIDFRSSNAHVAFVRPPASLIDGSDAPLDEPWLDWPSVGWFAEGKPFNRIEIDTFRRRLRVEAVTLSEDPRYPESWMRDVKLEYFDPVAEKWTFAMQMVSDSSHHSHTLPKPVEASRWRLVPADLSGNVRLAEIAFHGKDAGPSHPDAAARREVATLFDETDELRDAGYVPGLGVEMRFGGAFRGGRFLEMAADRSVAAPWRPPFGHVVPTWDFEIVEKPTAGQYRWLTFAAKGVTAKTTGLTLRLDGDAYRKTVACRVGAFKKEDDAIDAVVGDKVATEWTVYRVDLWDVLKKPTRIRGVRFAAVGGPAGFDRVLLTRTEAEAVKAMK